MKYKSNSIELVDKSDGEVIDITKLTDDIANVNVDEIVQRLLVLKELSILASNSYKLIELKFIQLMNEQDAKRYANDDAIINITPQATYEYDIEAIDLLKVHINEEQFNKTFARQYKVNRSSLKGIRILGGDIKKIINKMETKTLGKPTVNIAKK